MKNELKLINNNNTNEKIKILNLYKFGFLLPPIISTYYIIHNIIIGQLSSWENLYLLIMQIPFVYISLIIDIIITKIKKETKESNNAIKHGEKIIVELIEFTNHSKTNIERNVNLIFRKDDKEYILKNFNDYNFTNEFLEISNDIKFIIYAYKDNYYIQEKEVLDKMCKDLINIHPRPNPIKIATVNK